VVDASPPGAVVGLVSLEARLREQETHDHAPQDPRRGRHQLQPDQNAAAAAAFIQRAPRTDR
jgi:hypothetical protein